MKNISTYEIYEKVFQNLDLAVKNDLFYIHQSGFWERKTEQELVKTICGLFPEEDRGLISDYALRETMKRLRNNPNLEIEFTDDYYCEFLNLENGIFNVEEGELTDEDLGFSYQMKFRYISKNERNCQNFDKFIEDTFPEETQRKRCLLLEILGYCISNYQTAKAAFFLIGASNSGKSTMLELLRKIMPPDMVTAIPLQRLENPFNLAKLAEARVNICTEISESSLKSAEVFKMLTSCELVTAEHKGKTPFEFRIGCKSLNAGNFLPELRNAEGMDAILNRMVILYFPRSIPPDKQDHELVDKLFEERDSIFSEALDELKILVNEKNFCFVEPSDTKELKAQLYFRSHAFENFLNESCVFDENGKTHVAELYEKFMKYVSENLLDVSIGRSQFAQKIYRLPGVKRAKFRINNGSPRWGVIGMRLV